MAIYDLLALQKNGKSRSGLKEFSKGVLSMVQ